MGEKSVLGNRNAADEMLLNYPLEHRRGARVVPHSIGVNDRDRAVTTNPKTTRAGPIHERFGPGEIQLHEAPLEVLPRLDARIDGAALRFLGLRA